ncbi:DoxX family protein [Methylobacterium fujisawaense]
MRTDPFTDTWAFFLGQQSDQLGLGLGRWLVVAGFALLVMASILIALREWIEDPTQRSGRDLTMWVLRALVGAMWFQGMLWKLPFFSTENGLYFWTGEEVTNAAFQIHRDLVRNVLLPTPNFYILDIFVFLTELTFAASLLLGLGVRITGAIGVMFVAQLWLGLYLHPQEWPWTYVFLAGLMGLFSVFGAGRSLGLDADLRRRFPPGLTTGWTARFVRFAT